MAKALGFGVIVQLVVAAAVGVRLLALARRTREIPELALGISFVLLGLLGYPLSIIARAGLTTDLVAPRVLLGAALTIQDGSAVAMGIATWQTFRREAAWPALLIGASGVLLVASLAGHAAATRFEPASVGGPWYYVGLAVRAGAFAWAASESLRHFLLLRRRSRIGLADAVVVDRFRLWFLATAAITAGFAIFAIGQASGLRVAADARVLAATSFVGLVSGACMWLAFFPPRFYLLRFEAKSGPSF